MPDTLTSVHNIPCAHASAALTHKTIEVFKEEYNIAPIIISDTPKTFRTFSQPSLSALIIKKGVALVRTTPCEDCDPVGIQPQDLQNFFSTRIFCFKNKKGVAWKCYTLLCDPVGIQTQDLQNRNLTLYSAKLRDLQNQRMQN